MDPVEEVLAVNATPVTRTGSMKGVKDPEEMLRLFQVLDTTFFVDVASDMWKDIKASGLEHLFKESD